ncbi:MAG: hypothetical protein AAGD01_11700 [Acidobacteriota bacterium]
MLAATGSLLFLFLLGAAAGTAEAQVSTESPEPIRDPQDGPALSLRSTEILDLDCSSTIGRQRTTLFANGTVRVKEYARGWTDSATGERRDDLSVDGLGLGPRTNADTSVLRLGELTPEVLESILQRLRRIDLSEAREQTQDAIGGEWIDRCRLTVALSGRPTVRVVFGQWDSLDLEVSRALRLAESLEQWTEDSAPEGERFTANQLPQRGDRVVRADGEIFEVLGLTTDERGVELRGRRIPLTVFIALDDLRRNYRPWRDDAEDEEGY